MRQQVSLMNNTVISQKTSGWLDQPFFKESIVLGIDVGVEGIGVCLRRGPHLLAKKTLIFDLPEAKALKARREKRAARHCRKNRKTRLHRLHKLFIKHHLPWPTDEVLSRTDPFELRHRAVTSTLASPHAVGIAIRHVLLRRGYDFYANVEGEFPWGAEGTIKAASAWLKTTHIDEGSAEYLTKTLLPQLVRKLNDSHKELTETELRKEEDERDAFRHAVRERLRECETLDITAKLEVYRRSNSPRLRSAMRGENFPRTLVESHLREIITRHAHLISEVEAFTEALFRKPDSNQSAFLQKRDRERAIFHFNRKTQAEAKAIWERKTKHCTLAAGLGLPEAKVDKACEPAIRCWRVLEFAATRKVEITVGKTGQTSQVRLPDAAIRALVATVEQKPALKWTAVKAIVKDTLALATPGAVPVADTKSSFNKDFFSQLKDLTVPTVANGRQNASLCVATAEHLVQVATDGGKDYSPQGVNERLNAIHFYDLRRNGSSSGPLLPQVRFLLGQRAVKEIATPRWTVEGKLQRLFTEHAEALGGQTYPDFLIIECIGDAPRNLKQKKEIQDEQKERRTDRKKLFAGHNLDDSGVSSRRRRVILHDQQRGLCPFTGLPLGDPLGADLDLGHLFPQIRGGLATDANLVLTFRWVNQLMAEYTPREFAQHRPDSRVLSWKEMETLTKDFKWSTRKQPSQPHRKRDLFAFEGPDFPDFGNTTFTAQLARQLKHEASIWMGVSTDPEEARKRIGTPSGWLAAQARRSWILDPDGEPMQKNRGEPQHHLVDAFVLAHIPPAAGMNDIQYGGIFWSEWQTVVRPAGTFRRPVTKVLPGLLPPAVIAKELYTLLGNNPDTLAVEKHRARRKWATSLGDSTFWKVDFKTGTTYQRKPLKRSKKGYRDAQALAATLRMTRIPAQLMPSTRELERWLTLAEDDVTELKLKDGTPIRNVWKLGKKNSLRGPLGWTADPATFDEKEKRFLILDEASEALEIWLGWDGKKWAFIKRRKPERTALRHLRRFAGPLKDIAPIWMQYKPHQTATLEKIICGNTLPPGARKLCSFRKGDPFRVSFTPEGKIRPYHESLSSTWVEVSAIGADLRVEFAESLSKPPKKFSLGAVPDLLAIAGHFTDAATTAAALGLNPPLPPHDPPSDPSRRPRTRDPRPSGQADLFDPQDRD